MNSETQSNSAAAIRHKLEMAIKSGRLTTDVSFSIPKLAAVLEMPVRKLRRQIRKEMGSTTAFYDHIGFGRGYSPKEAPRPGNAEPISRHNDKTQ